MPGQRRTAVKRDDEAGKRYPSSLAQLVLAVRQYWLQQRGAVRADRSPLSVTDFLKHSDFESCFIETTALYPKCANPPKTTTAIRNALNDMGSGSCDMEYYRLRALARFTGLTPAGLILLFAQLVGEEQRAKRDKRDPKLAILQILNGVIRVAEAAKKQVDATPDGLDTFMRNYDDTPHGRLPDVELLDQWRKAFIDGPLPPDSSKT